jgi:hypothetical protein
MLAQRLLRTCRFCSIPRRVAVIQAQGGVLGSALRHRSAVDRGFA